MGKIWIEFELNIRFIDDEINLKVVKGFQRKNRSLKLEKFEIQDFA